MESVPGTRPWHNIDTEGTGSHQDGYVKQNSVTVLYDPTGTYRDTMSYASFKLSATAHLRNDSDGIQYFADGTRFEIKLGKITRIVEVLNGIVTDLEHKQKMVLQGCPKWVNL